MEFFHLLQMQKINFLKNLMRLYDIQITIIFFRISGKKKTNVFVVRCKPDFFFGEVSTLSEISFVRCIQLIKTFTKETFKLGSIKMKTAIQTDYSHLYRIAQNGSRSRKLRP